MIYRLSMIKPGPAEGMATIAGQPWSRVVSRKSGTCAMTKRPFVRGALVYRPLTDDMNRADRILAVEVDPVILMGTFG